MKRFLWLLVASACGSTTPAAQAPGPTLPLVEKTPAKKVTPLVEYEAPPKKLNIDWASTSVATDAEANAVWAQIAPTGDDWQLKLDEVPLDKARPLAIALIHGGNFTCTKPAPASACAPLVLDVPEPAPTTTLDDPCLRRVLGLWALAALEPTDAPVVMDSLRAIVQIPPPESQLVAAAIEAVPEADQDRRLELIALAYKAGEKDVANGQLGTLDDGHLVSAAMKHHIDGALEVLSAKGFRQVFLTAVTDEQLPGKTRADAIAELITEEDKLPADTKAALVKATKSPDCQAAAAAARALAKRGDKRFVPAPPRTMATAMHDLCVLAAYERMMTADEDSIVPKFVPAKGLELSVVLYDAYSETDDDGDGDPHTSHTTTLIPRDNTMLPEQDDMLRAFRSCTGTICASADRDFRFTFKPSNGALLLSRIELVDRPPCPVSR